MKNVLLLLQEFGIQPKYVGTYDKGDVYHSACPRSGCSKEDGFHVWPSENNGAGAWWCRKCGKGGDGIQFLRDFRGMSFKDACNALDISKTDYKIQPKIEYKKPEFEPKAAVLPADQWQEKAKILIGHCHLELLKNEKQLKWLEKRGISIESVKKYQLGWNEKAIYRARSAWGLPEKMTKGKPAALWIPDGLVIPFIDGDVVHRIRIRRGPGDYQLLSGSKGTPRLLGDNMKGFIVVETELDGFMLQEKAGDVLGVLMLGAVAVKPTDVQYELLKKAVRILVALDLDGQPGGNATKWWMKNFNNCRRWPVPVGKDPGEAFEKGLDIRKWVMEGLPPVFKIKKPAFGLCRGNVEKGGGAEKPVPRCEKTVTPAPDIHPDVLQLWNLIKKIKVKIIMSEGTRLEIPKCFEKRNPDKCCEISALVFSSYVDEYLTKHPAEIIDNKNFWESAA